MTLRNHPLAALMATLMLTGHCSAQSNPLSAPVSTAPSDDLISGLGPKLEGAVARINRLSAPLGLAGWPGVRSAGVLDLPNASLEDRVFRNNRVLILHRRSSNTYTALVLMREVPAGPEVYYHLVVVGDMFGEAIVRKMPGECSRTYADGECLWFEGGNVRSGDAVDLIHWPHPGVRVLPDSTLQIAITEEGTDNFGCLLYSPQKPLSILINYLLDAHNKAESDTGQEEDAFGNSIKRSDFNQAKKTAEDSQFIWFQVGEEPYAAEKKDWNRWMKEPHSLEAP